MLIHIGEMCCVPPDFGFAWVVLVNYAEDFDSNTWEIRNLGIKFVYLDSVSDVARKIRLTE